MIEFRSLYTRQDPLSLPRGVIHPQLCMWCLGWGYSVSPSVFSAVETNLIYLSSLSMPCANSPPGTQELSDCCSWDFRQGEKSICSLL